MDIASLVFGIIGAVTLLIGLIFIIPYKTVSKFSKIYVQGEIVDMTWNAAEFNAPRDEQAGVNREIGGMTVAVGGRSSTANNRSTANMYHMVYRYFVNGMEYMRADGLRYNSGYVNRRLGQQVKVYYNPTNPQESTLSNGSGYKLVVIILISVSVLMFLLSIGFLVLDNVA